MADHISRDVYRHADLQRLFAPRSIAIVGISERPGSYGERTLHNLIQGKFPGHIHLVNARYDRIGALPCHPDLKSLPEVPDCVVLAVPREAAEAVITECAELGVGGVVLYASGYSEVGLSERIAQQDRLTAIARAGNVRIIGPNCLGYLNHCDRIAATFTQVNTPTILEDHAIGLVSQSGALGFGLSQAVERGVSVGMLLTAGNSCDVDIADEIAYLAEEPRCKAIACLFEGLFDPERLMQAAELAWKNDKPIVMHKIATGAAGIEAALKHTATPAGSDAAWRAAFKRAGIVTVDDLDALIETASFFAKAPQPRARGVAVASTSGGAAIMAADKAAHYGVPLPQPEEATLQVLREHVPEYGSVRNPCDVTGQVTGNPASILAVGNALMSDPNYGVVLLPYPQINATSAARNTTLSEIAGTHSKMACNVWISEWREGPGAIEAERLPHLAVFRSMDRCFAAIAAWHAREDLRSEGISDWSWRN